MRAAGGGGRPGPAEGGKRKEARVCGPLSENRSVTCTSCPRRRTFSLPRSAVFVKREAAPHRRPHRAQAGHCAARPPRSRFSAAFGAAVFLAPEAAPCRKVGPAQPHPARLCRAMPGKALPVPALPEMTPGRPRGAGHPLDALGWPLPGPAARGLFCLPPAASRAGDYRPASVRGSPRTTPGHPAQGSRPRPLAGPGRCAPLRRLSRCGYPRSAPPHCPAQRGARRHAACGSSRGPS